jgi:hypothetical protein
MNHGQNDPAPEELVTVSLPPALEEPLVDWLLEHQPDLGFTSVAAYGHGLHPERLSLAEQVTGKQRRVEIRIVMPAGRSTILIEQMAAAFAHTDTFYWVTPVLRSGRFHPGP